jgi:alkylated DNA repair dioxygenase AlkB
MTNFSVQLTTKGTTADNLELIKGLVWIPEFLTVTQQERLQNYLTQQSWQRPLWLPQNHQLQVYGWQERPTYDRSYFNRKRDYLGTLPEVFQTLQRRLKPWLNRCDQVVIHQTIGQSIINDSPDHSLTTLPPGLHLDHSQNFGQAIAIVALSSLDIQFRKGMREPIVMNLEAGDGLILQDEVRYQWLHQVLFNDQISQLFITVRTVTIADTN